MDILAMVGDFIGDFAGEFTEGIKDVTVDIVEFSKDTMEHFGDKGMEALENGDLKGAIENYDGVSKEDKDAAKEMVESLKPNVFSLVSSGTKVVGGTLGAIVALATPGFQPAGVAAGALAVKGMGELASQLGSKNVAALAKA